MDQLHLGLASAVALPGPSQLGACLAATKVPLAAWCLLSSLEWLWNRSVFKSDGLLSWRLLSLRSEPLYRAGIPDALMSDRPLAVLLLVRALAALLLLAMSAPAAVALILAFLLLSSVLLKIRTWLGEDGADQMGQIVTIGAIAMAGGLSIGDDGIALAGVLLIAGQLSISYFVAGFSKLLSREWRSGQAIVGVMGTHSYGHPGAAKYFSGRPPRAVAACWAVMVVEAAFPLALLAPPFAFWAVLSLFAAFHLATALFMGLNTFVWAFLAAYPAAVLVNLQISRALGWS